MPINFASLQDPHRQLLIVDDFRSIFIDKRSVVYLLAEPQCVTKLHNKSSASVLLPNPSTSNYNDSYTNHCSNLVVAVHAAPDAFYQLIPNQPLLSFYLPT
jgi:hypothetical protein